MKRQPKVDILQLQAKGIVLITRAQMAAAIQVSLRTLTGMMNRGEISYHRFGKRIIRFEISEALARMSRTTLVPHQGRPSINNQQSAINHPITHR